MVGKKDRWLAEKKALKKVGCWVGWMEPQKGEDSVESSVHQTVEPMEKQMGELLAETTAERMADHLVVQTGEKMAGSMVSNLAEMKVAKSVVMSAV